MRLLPIIACLVIGIHTVAAGETPQATLDEILAKPEYHRWQVTPPGGESDLTMTTPSWLLGIGDRLNRWLDDWLRKKDEKERREARSRSIASSGGSAGDIFKMIGFAVLGAMALFLLYSIFRWWQEADHGKKREKAKGRTPDMTRALEDGDALAFDDDSWNEEARRRYEKGDVRQAYRSLYLGLLSGLHERHRIVFAKNRTNWNYVRNFRGEQEMRSEFAALTGIFDQVWYGISTDAVDGDLREMTDRTKRLLEDGQAT